MLTNGQYIVRHSTSFFAGIFAMPLVDSIFSIGFTAFLAFPITYFGLNKGILFYQQSKRAKQLNLSRSQFIHIEEQLSIATKNANALTQKYVQVRSVKSFKVIYEMSKLSKRIIALVRKDPSKFYMIEEFFYAHLPSALELSDKYALLTKEQVTGTEIHVALNDARVTLKDLYETMESDLKKALSSDIESLKIELDFAKLANEQRQNELKVGGDN
jgi:5-bromo-4-chloroindolyl phosphate hydrolysis protein